MTVADAVALIAMVIGLIGIVLTIMPGTSLIAVTLLVWAVVTSSTTGWVLFAVTIAILAVGQVVKYAAPGRKLDAAGVPRRTTLAGLALGIVGFFVVPIVGLPLGFALGVYLAEAYRLGWDNAWPSTKAALAAVGLSILIDLGFASTAISVWLATVLLT